MYYTSKLKSTDDIHSVLNNLQCGGLPVKYANNCAMIQKRKYLLELTWIVGELRVCHQELWFLNQATVSRVLNLKKIGATF